MATRVFELAKDLGVTSKAVLIKCRAEGLDLKNHMATLSAGLEATIREWFSEGAEKTAVEVTEHVDLDAERKKATHTRRRPLTETAVADEETLTEELPEEAAVADEAPAEDVEAEEPAEAAAPAAEFVQPVEAGSPPASAEAVEPPAAPVEEAAAAAPVEPPKSEPIKPAGPQVVPGPAKLRGPRVVRVEKPDFVARPRPSSRPRPGAATPAPAEARPARTAGGGAAPSSDEDEDQKGKAKRRSPRRRGGRSADSGDTLHEWRDTDLRERSARLAAATGGGLRRRRANVSRGGNAPHEAGPAGAAEVAEPITIKDLSAASGIKSAELIKKLMAQGKLMTVNQVIDRATATALMLDWDIELVVRRSWTAEEEMMEALAVRSVGEQASRAPVVTFLGHVDHGKTSLMDKIRKTGVAAGEAGGITQHIGAYRYDHENTHVVFLDTPGHEAFTAMRARGANMTDVVVLVVAADDGVMPQTVEAISHARAAGVPIVVALNKVDVPNANIQRALGQLAEHNLQPRQWGGDVEVVETSAVTGKGVNELVELLGLEAEMLELKAEPQAPATGFVVESRMTPGLGPVATLLVRNGTLKVGNVVVAGRSYGRVRQMTGDRGQTMQEAPPSTPVEVAGLDEVAEAGDRFYVIADLDQARSISEDHRSASRRAGLAGSPSKSLADLLGQIKAGEAKELAIILKADVQGSIEAIVGSLAKLGNEDTRVKILHAAVGGISTGDVMLASASDAIIIGFNVVADSSARQMAEEKGVDIHSYSIIYDITEDVKTALEKGLAPEIREETIGHAEVRQTFRVSRVGTIAGCFVTDGVAARNASVRIIRNSIVIESGRTLESLKRFKDDAREVRAGMECGIKVAGYDDLKESDVFEFYRQVEVARKL